MRASLPTPADPARPADGPANGLSPGQLGAVIAVGVALIYAVIIGLAGRAWFAI